MNYIKYLFLAILLSSSYMGFSQEREDEIELPVQKEHKHEFNMHIGFGSSVQTSFLENHYSEVVKNDDGSPYNGDRYNGLPRLFGSSVNFQAGYEVYKNIFVAFRVNYMRGSNSFDDFYYSDTVTKDKLQTINLSIGAEYRKFIMGKDLSVTAGAFFGNRWFFWDYDSQKFNEDDEDNGISGLFTVGLDYNFWKEKFVVGPEVNMFIGQESDFDYSIGVRFGYRIK